MTTLALHDVTQRFTARAGVQVVAVDNVSLELSSEPATLTSLVGASGSGKSTIARIMLGLQTPTSGSVTFDGTPLRRLGRKARDDFRTAVQPVFQDPYAIFNPFYRVDRVFWIAIHKFGLVREPRGASRAAGLRLIRRSLAAVQLDPDEVLGRYPHQLSGGQRQRLMLARVHLLRPAILIADEPVSMLDAQLRVSFLDILLDLREQLGMTTLFITHDLSTVAYLGGRMMTMLRGRIVEEGPAAELLSTPAHEYTRMLLASVPSTDPDQRWTDRLEMVDGQPRIVRD
jgi:peptide/nickel transport system ATP-binding protein